VRIAAFIPCGRVFRNKDDTATLVKAGLRKASAPAWPYAFPFSVFVIYEREQGDAPGEKVATFHGLLDGVEVNTTEKIFSVTADLAEGIVIHDMEAQVEKPAVVTIRMSIDGVPDQTCSIEISHPG
jgi:hypothetical protein